MQVYNTLNRTKESFIPQDGNKVRMYVCGITAYDLCHIGHARSAVVFDVLVRYLRHLGFEVTFVRNFTDIDDKIINRAKDLKISPKDLAEKFIDAFYEDMDRLGILRADIEPKCTEHISEMIALTKTLVDNGHAYVTPGKDVYFRVRRLRDYGQLSNRALDEMRAGARIAPGEEKEDPLDFALWKNAKPSEPCWDSPWGQGRPGWHLECSAMAEKYMPLPLDIHGGGQDLVFPHHENEIAQTKAATGKNLAAYWMHNGFVQINAEKMSKSLGNFLTIRDILNKYQPESLRFFLISKHYRSPLDFSPEAMDEAEKGLKRVYTAMLQVDEGLRRESWTPTPMPVDVIKEMETAESEWRAAMDDDMNTAAALGHMFTLVRLAGRILDDKGLKKSQSAKDTLTRIRADMNTWGKVLGLFQDQPSTFLMELRNIKAQRKGIDAAKVEGLLQDRLTARQNKDFARSDALRNEIAALGVEVKDTAQGQQWDIL